MHAHRHTQGREEKERDEMGCYWKEWAGDERGQRGLMKIIYGLIHEWNRQRILKRKWVRSLSRVMRQEGHNGPCRKRRCFDLSRHWNWWRKRVLSHWLSALLALRQGSRPQGICGALVPWARDLLGRWKWQGSLLWVVLKGNCFPLCAERPGHIIVWSRVRVT